MPRILIVDDEQDLCEILQFNLEAEGYTADTACSAEEALSMMSDRSSVPYDLVLLDVMMDQMSGYDMARTLRDEGNETPIIFLTAKDSHDNQLEGFSVGADDYITKPYAFDTVLARVKAVLKRTLSTGAASPDGTGCIRLDAEHGQALVDGFAIELTRKEFAILELLIAHAGEYLSREDILRQAWPDDIYVADRSVDVHIARIRKKLGSEGSRIVNRTGYGYSLSNE